MKSHFITIANQKGGVGKTTTVVNLATAFALKGYPTLVVDLDPQGQCATALGLPQDQGVFNYLTAGRPLSECLLMARPYLDIMAGNVMTGYTQMIMVAQNEPASILRTTLAKTGYRYIIFDTSPSIGGLQERALFAADHVIIPTAMDFLSAESVAQTLNTIHDLSEEKQWTGSLYGILPTFMDEVTSESRTILNELRMNYGSLVITPPIHRTTQLREATASGKTIFEVAPDSRAAIEYGSLALDLINATRND